MIFLIRKGGIHEQSSCFSLSYERAFLFPSFEHQQNTMLKLEAAPANVLNPYQSGNKVPLKNWVEFREIFEIKTSDVLPQLAPYHLWTNEFLQQKLLWKPERPLYCILCRTYRLDTSLTISFERQYGGCRSWIELEKEIPFQPCTSTKSDAEFETEARKLRQILQPSRF